MAGYFVNELLCFLMSYYGKMPKYELISILVGFYEDDELVAAKELMFEVAEGIKPKIDGLPSE